MHNSTSLLVGVGVLAIVGILVFFQTSDDSAPAQNNAAQKENVGTATMPSASSSYTAAEVAQHATPADCWTIINGSVYDLTEWISRHPGGERAITRLCGIDGSEEFNEQHGGGPQQASILAGYKLGSLTQ